MAVPTRHNLASSAEAIFFFDPAIFSVKSPRMPKISQITRLFEKLSVQDWNSSNAIALEIANSEEERGHIAAARKLRSAINGLASNPGTLQPPSSTSTNPLQLSKVLTRCHEGKTLSEVSLRRPMKESLQEILAEWKASDRLAKAGISRRHRLLFLGPPGCGKTVTAIALAREMKIPAYVVRFDSLIGSFLGQTASNLREVFNYVAYNRCVLLFDEIDVLGKRRGNQMDVGELDRIVVGLMQELDLASFKGLVIGASNLTSHLDPALIRRFDLSIEFPAPNRAELIQFFNSTTKRLNVSPTTTLKRKLLRIKDYATVERMVVDELRRKIINEGRQ